jgi:hypothetical protein
MAGAAPRAPASRASPQSGRKRINFEDIQLFERREWEKSLFDRTGTSPIWSGEIPLGDYGYIAVDLTARWRANAAALAGLGPGMLRRIWVDADPGAERGEGHAELYLPADVGARVLLGGSVEGHTAYLDVVPLLTLEGGLAGAGTASVPGAIMVPVSVTYERGALGLVVNPKVGLGLLFTFNLDAWAAAALFGHELARKLWHVVDWRWGRAWQLGVRVKVEYKDGKLAPIEVDFQPPAPLPIEDILPEALSASAQATSLAQAEQALLSAAQPSKGKGDFPLTYRTGSRGRKNLTPRPDKDPEGLSTYEEIATAFRRAPPDVKKAQKIDTTKLKELKGIQDPPPEFHVTITPGSEEKVREWAATRDDESQPEHRWTGEVRNAIVPPEVTRP